jgi:hypothetical protein
MKYMQRVEVGKDTYVYPKYPIELNTEGHMYLGCSQVNCKHINNCNKCMLNFAKGHQFQIKTLIIQNYNLANHRWELIK